MAATEIKGSTLDCCLLLYVPLELQLDILEIDAEVYLKWPLLSKKTAMTTRFDCDLNKHGKWQKHRKTKKKSRRKNILTHYQIVCQEYWRHGKLHGDYKEWHGCGQLMKRCPYVNGNKEGVQTLWYYNGDIWTQSHYVNGKREGEHKVWYSNGQLSIQCYFANDTLVGEYKRWERNGQLSAHTSYS
mmetsp:Transcript_1932/g.2142  ORF Transcript_1932/g.2142 Transcript_1932/m.2142 type:complete len:186 (+) Transcript_1932:49-606(+)